jgi:hypothetical protein
VLSDLLAEKGLLEEAVRFAQKAAELDPEHLHYRLRLAQISAKLVDAWGYPRNEDPRTAPPVSSAI